MARRYFFLNLILILQNSGCSRSNVTNRSSISTRGHPFCDQSLAHCSRRLVTNRERVIVLQIELIFLSFRMNGIRKSLTIIPILKSKMSKLSDSNMIHSQYAAAVDNLKQIYHINETVENAEKMIENEMLLHAHKKWVISKNKTNLLFLFSIMELEDARDNLMSEVYKVNSDRKDFDLNVSRNKLIYLIRIFSCSRHTLETWIDWWRNWARNSGWFVLEVWRLCTTTLDRSNLFLLSESLNANIGKVFSINFISSF